MSNNIDVDEIRLRIKNECSDLDKLIASLCSATPETTTVEFNTTSSNVQKLGFLLNKTSGKGGISTTIKGDPSTKIAQTTEKEDTGKEETTEKSGLKSKVTSLFKKEFNRHKKNLQTHLDNKVPGMSLKETLKNTVKKHIPMLKEHLHDEIDNHIEEYIKNSKTLDELIESKIRQLVQD